jgi:hypothetical protein
MVPWSVGYSATKHGLQGYHGILTLHFCASESAASQLCRLSSASSPTLAPASQNFVGMENDPAYEHRTFIMPFLFFKFWLGARKTWKFFKFIWLESACVRERRRLRQHMGTTWLTFNAYFKLSRFLNACPPWFRIKALQAKSRIFRRLVKLPTEFIVSSLSNSIQSFQTLYQTRSSYHSGPRERRYVFTSSKTHYHRGLPRCEGCRCWVQGCVWFISGASSIWSAILYSSLDRLISLDCIQMPSSWILRSSRQRSLSGINSCPFMLLPSHGTTKWPRMPGG